MLDQALGASFLTSMSTHSVVAFRESFAGLDNIKSHMDTAKITIPTWRLVQ